MSRRLSRCKSSRCGSQTLAPFSNQDTTTLSREWTKPEAKTNINDVLRLIRRVINHMKPVSTAWQQCEKNASKITIL